MYSIFVFNKNIFICIEYYLMNYVMNYCVRVYIPNWLKSAITGLGMEPSSGLL